MMDSLIYKYLTKYVIKNKFILVYAFAISIAQSLLLIPTLYYIKKIFDNSIPNKNMDDLIFNSIMIFVLTVLQSLMGYGYKNLFLKVVKKSTSILQKDVLKHLIYSDKRFYDTADHAKMINSTVSDVDKVDRMTDGILSVAIPQFTLFALGIIIMIVYNPIIGLACLLLGGIGFMIQKSARKSIISFIKNYRDSIDNLTNYVTFLPKKFILIKLRNYEAKEHAYAGEASDTAIDSGKNAAKKGLEKQTLQDLIINISAIFLIVLGSFQILIDTASYGNIFGLYFLIVFIRRSAYNIQSQWISIQEGKVSIRRIFELLSSPLPTSNNQANTDFVFDGSLSAKNIVFGYGKQKVLNGVSFNILKGEVVTISGANGSGKSSLVNIILGLYPPESGQLLVNGVNYTDLDIGKLREYIGYVPQNQILVNGTIKSNLTYGLAQSNTAYQAKLETSELFKHLMMGFKDGLNTEVGLDGKNLSNGQIQRISILRALYSEPSLLILDEPTNHLDAESISTLIKEIKQGLQLTILVISHHKLFNDISDKIFELENGILQQK
ncbi:ABC transporter ATP-binding protein [Ekhidna sp. To15]|uniref:ABC transporter ATP-binding protein n=1 Tax=Ekhidna sp. To15 TaxID=3395267 RepID=UPI003F51DBD5